MAINQIPMPKGVLVIKDITEAEFRRFSDDFQHALSNVPDDDLDKIMVIGNHDVEYISFEDRALKLWREFVNYCGDDPFVDDTTDHGYVPTCYFCSENKPNHDAECIYIRVKKLLEAKKA